MGIMFVGHGAVNGLNRRNVPPNEILMKVRLSKAVPRRKLRE